MFDTLRLYGKPNRKVYMPPELDWHLKHTISPSELKSVSMSISSISSQQTSQHRFNAILYVTNVI
ncbi:hypothetical protein DYY66_2293 [Candidatus Nitrosotalea sp. FS]|nr:hypothetical protein [Candidatus Nitrosotalea sp. FS]